MTAGQKGGIRPESESSYILKKQCSSRFSSCSVKGRHWFDPLRTPSVRLQSVQKHGCPTAQAE